LSLVKALKGSIVSIAIVLIILIIIMPLPSQVLDFLLMLNLALAMTILLITTNITSTLQFSIFPSLLLLTTLFRLSLEIQSTRLILSNGGKAGDVINTFGTFVIPNGNVVIGLIVFLIIVVAQFLVITKGAERVSEVAARFTLDAMPGKQMAIDADLNSGLITEDAARRRRSDIQREADFYGSMDGASKFVKGDAVLAIVVMIINIIGGIISGLIMNGGDINTVMSTYTIATVGSGLMSQIPALLISTSTGIIVTRAASEDNMSAELARQLFSQPIVLRTAGIVMLLMMLIRGFPWPTLLIIGGMFILLSFQLGRNKAKGKPKQQEAEKLSNVNSEIEMLKNPENVYSMLEVETIEMEFGYSLIPLVEESQGGTFVDKVVLFRRQFALESGIVIPSVRMRDNIQLPNNRYVIKIRGEKVAEGSLLVGNLLIMNPMGDEFLIDGIDTIEPAFGLSARWIAQEKRDEAEMDGYTVIEPASVMMTHLSEVIRRHAAELIGRREMNSVIDVIKKHNSALVDEVIPNKISVGDLQKVFQNLIRENIPVRDSVTILETIADNTPKIKDTDILTEYVRQSLKRTITHKIAPEGELKVMTIDPTVEKQITSSVRTSDQGAYLALEPDVAQSIIDNLSREIERFNKAGISPVVLVSPAVRMYFKRLTEQVLPDLFVVSYNEIDNDIKITAVGAVAA
jgi:flagellar biosynthesis protein FlhA